MQDSQITTAFNSVNIIRICIKGTGTESHTDTHGKDVPHSVI